MNTVITILSILWNVLGIVTDVWIIAVLVAALRNLPNSPGPLETLLKEQIKRFEGQPDLTGRA